VSISSAYGGGTVKADAEGHWELKVIFGEAPFEKTFEVKVKDHTGAKKVFPFTSYFSG
jgi:IS4 transposase